MAANKPPNPQPGRICEACFSKGGCSFLTMSIEAQSQAENLHQNSSKQELESPRPATQKLKHPFISRQLPLLAKVADDEDQQVVQDTKLVGVGWASQM